LNLSGTFNVVLLEGNIIMYSGSLVMVFLKRMIGKLSRSSPE
jgi:hypothetical protein